MSEVMDLIVIEIKLEQVLVFYVVGGFDVYFE